MVNESAVEDDELLSECNSSETTFFDAPALHKKQYLPIYVFNWFRQEGRLNIFFEWQSKKAAASRLIVLGPDWLCVLLTLVLTIVPSVFVYMYVLKNLPETIVFYCVVGLVLISLLVVIISDPGLVRKYHHARDNKWTFCAHCESFRPPNTVHCSTCRVCIGGYDHHCSWTGKCVGKYDDYCTRQ